MDCSEALTDWHDSMHEFSNNFGGYIDSDPNVSWGDLFSSGLGSVSDYMVSGMACGDHHDSSSHPDSGTDAH